MNNQNEITNALEKIDIMSNQDLKKEILPLESGSKVILNDKINTTKTIQNYISIKIDKALIIIYSNAEKERHVHIEANGIIYVFLQLNERNQKLVKEIIKKIQ